MATDYSTFVPIEDSTFVFFEDFRYTGKIKPVEKMCEYFAYNHTLENFKDEYGHWPPSCDLQLCNDEAESADDEKCKLENIMKPSDAYDEVLCSLTPSSPAVLLEAFRRQNVKLLAGFGGTAFDDRSLGFLKMDSTILALVEIVSEQYKDSVDIHTYHDDSNVQVKEYLFSPIPASSISEFSFRIQNNKSFEY